MIQGIFRGVLGLFLSLEAANAFAEAKIAELRVYPENVKLETSADRQLIVVQIVRNDGVTQDVSGEAKLSLVDGAIAKLNATTLVPHADGKTELRVEFGGQTKLIPVEVTKAADARAVSFKLDVMPIFMKSGCNSGSCHGAARGKDGFRLSLFGYDPDGDYHRVVRELPGRRVDMAVPEASLLVEKSIGAVPHSGGKRFEMSSELNQTLVNWVAANCPQDPADIPVCTGLSLYPPDGVLDGEGAKQQVTVRATYSDGSDRDVTALTLFMSNNDNSATITQEGLIQAGARGEAFVMARFSTFTVGSHFVVLPKWHQYEAKRMPAVNYVDELVNKKLMKLRIEPSGRADDEAFLRRVYLDLVGILPTEEEYASFMNDPDSNKRDKLIDQLIERKEFTEVWVSKWAEWLMMRSSNQTSYKSIVLYYNWLSEQIAGNVPLNVMVRDILSANGGTFKNAPTNFYQIERDTLKVSENVAQIFMGMRTQCAQCHNHPFDRWTQDDYYSFASFFSQIGRKEAEDYRETIVFNSGGGDVRHPVTGKVMEPIFLGGPKADTKGKDRREVLANWLASPENPYFAENFVNRVWHHFYGIGIVDPIDDVRISNPPSNAPLLKELAKRFTESNYNFKQLVKDIVKSEAYQRSTQRNESNATDEKNFAHQSLRRIKAESMLDIITQVTSGREKFRGLPVGARAVQIADGQTSNYFLTTFGRATRETACSCEVKMEPTLSQALHLLNGDSSNQKIAQGNLVGKLLQEKVAPEEIVNRLYIRCLSRKPTTVELEALRPVLAESKDPKRDLDDVFWALLNSREFIFNH
ncbi:MAG: cell surface protein [Planctomyces sp.]|nr:cell surface protein [Planctomyces sp.]